MTNAAATSNAMERVAVTDSPPAGSGVLKEGLLRFSLSLNNPMNPAAARQFAAQSAANLQSFG
jgi:hypothetical protein